MSENIVSKNRLALERKVLYLLLHDKGILSDFLDTGYPISLFSPDHKPLVNAILETYQSHDVLLRKAVFKDWLKKISVPKDRIRYEMVFNQAFSAKVTPDEFPFLIEKLHEEHVHDQVNDSLAKFGENLKKRNKIDCVRLLLEDCENIISTVGKVEGDHFYDDIRTLTKDRIQYIEDVRSGKIVEEPLVLSGIREIDDTMITGFERGTLTLFCADVGGFKSAMMLNVALNVWRSGYDVLFVPLEMHRVQMWRRACAREAKIDQELITRNVKDLTDAQMEKIRQMEVEFDEAPAKFYIMQEPGRVKVSQIQRQIERNIDIIRPRLVVVDYVANLLADQDRYGRNDLEIGDMLKDMREMGKTMGFSVVSAAQLGRPALQRIRKAGANNDKATLNSEDIRGSHEYSADADNIYAMLRNPNEPDEQLFLYCIKARNGKTTFGTGKSSKAVLSVNAAQGRIWSPMDEVYGAAIGSKEPTPDETIPDKDDDNFIDNAIYKQEDHDKSRMDAEKEEWSKVKDASKNVASADDDEDFEF